MAVDMAYFREHTVAVGISACLLGRPVRYDGRDQRHDWLVDELGPNVRWVPVCPEVEAGMGVPRPPITLARIHGATRLFDTRDGRDITGEMQRFAAARAHALRADELAGYVLKSRSPSCGVAGARVLDHPGAERFERTGQGLFAAALLATFPGLPVVEEHELDAVHARADFLDRMRAYDLRRRRARGQAP